ncbi:MAG: hypothetical protein IKV50_07365 [Clostridia bacterium]|nr:hypothetical protein [Clostridia bacterium]MBR6554302.1 hypothetical protein [Clostridia bacterium]
MKRVLLAILAAVLCFALASCDAKRISESKVEKAELNGHLLPEEDLNTFIYWFNKAEYKGEGTGEGGTPEYSLEVFFKDGSFMRISDFNGRGITYEVSRFDAERNQTEWYYVYIDELETFFERMYEKHSFGRTA